MLTVMVQPSAMPSRNPTATWKRSAEKDLVKDLDAFKRMRVAGETPKSTRGAAVMESQAESSFEIASGQLAHKMAKGADAGKSVSRRGKEWRRRADAAYTALRKGDLANGV
jgi:hypothetical protein